VGLVVSYSAQETQRDAGEDRSVRTAALR
jgi:hypothetical protein